MHKVNKKNIKIANFLKRKKQNNEEQIIYRTSDTLSLSNNSKSKDNSNSKSENTNTNNLDIHDSFKSNSNSNNSKSDNNSYKSDTSMNEKTNTSSYETQSIKSKSPLFKSIKTDTDTEFNNWDIDVISSKIKKMSSIDGCSVTSECNNHKSSKKGEFTPTNSESNINWDFIEKKTNNTITIEKNNISITIDESNNIKIKFM